jgi:hypothetical protein
MPSHWKHVTMQRRWSRAAPWPPVGVVAALASTVAAATGVHGIGPERLETSPLGIAPVLSADPHDVARDDRDASSHHSRGIRLLGRRLADGGKAVRVRARRRRRLVTDGPFVETKEWIAGPASSNASAQRLHPSSTPCSLFSSLMPSAGHAHRVKNLRD